MCLLQVSQCSLTNADTQPKNKKKKEPIGAFCCPDAEGKGGEGKREWVDKGGVSFFLYLPPCLSHLLFLRERVAVYLSLSPVLKVVKKNNNEKKSLESNHVLV